MKLHETTPARQNETEGGFWHRLNLKQHLRYKIGKSSNVKFQLQLFKIMKNATKIPGNPSPGNLLGGGNLDRGQRTHCHVRAEKRRSKKIRPPAYTTAAHLGCRCVLEIESPICCGMAAPAKRAL